MRSRYGRAEHHGQAGQPERSPYRSRGSLVIGYETGER